MQEFWPWERGGRGVMRDVRPGPREGGMVRWKGEERIPLDMPNTNDMSRFYMNGTRPDGDVSVKDAMARARARGLEPGRPLEMGADYAFGSVPSGAEMTERVVEGPQGSTRTRTAKWLMGKDVAPREPVRAAGKGQSELDRLVARQAGRTPQGREDARREALPREAMASADRIARMQFVEGPSAQTLMEGRKPVLGDQGYGYVDAEGNSQVTPWAVRPVINQQGDVLRSDGTVDRNPAAENIAQAQLQQEALAAANMASQRTGLAPLVKDSTGQSIGLLQPNGSYRWQPITSASNWQLDLSQVPEWNAGSGAQGRQEGATVRQPQIIDDPFYWIRGTTPAR